MLDQGNSANQVIDDFLDIRADVRDQALQQCKTSLREKNKHEWTCELEIMGNTEIVSGVTFEVQGFGIFDGKYLCTQVIHKLGGGYTTKIKGHRVLNGY